MKINISRRNMERGVYILLISILVVYGMKDSEGAAMLIHAVKEAFSVLISNP